MYLKRKKSVLGLIVILILTLSLLSGGCGAQKTVAVEEKYIPVEVQSASMSTLVETAVFSGKVYADQELNIMPKISGKVTGVNVKVGSPVKAGAVLFTLDKEDLQKAVDQAALVVRTAEANYDRTKEQVDLAKINLERQQQLYNAGAISKSQLESSESQASAKPLELAQIQWDQAKLSLQQAQDALSNSVVRAPIDGTISAVNVKYGETASNVQQAITLTTLDNLYVSINVDENIVVAIKPGQNAKVTVSSTGGAEITGKIDTIAPSANPQTQLYAVKVKIDNKDGVIKPGMFAKVELSIKNKDNVLAVNSEAVVLKNGKNTVYVVEGDRAVAKEVVTGLDTGVLLEIVKGLNSGDKVIVKGQTLVEQGSKVKVVGGSAS